MKISLKLVPAALMITALPAFALNPINGWYAGLVLGGSYAPDTDINFRLPTFANNTCPTSNSTCSSRLGKLTYSGFGNIGGQIGVRRNHLRLEIEPVANYNPYQKIISDGTQYNSPKSSTGLRLDGSTTTGMLMVNGFYDFYSTTSDSNFVPYLGAGVGYAYVKNSFKFYCNNQEIACTSISQDTNSAALQGIAGAAYFMDSFTWFGLDYRYITTKKINLLDARVQVHTINLSFNGMFYC